MKIILRANESHNIGVGHVMRLLALSQEMRSRGISTIFAGRCDTEEICNLIKKNVTEFAPIIGEDNIETDLKQYRDIFSNNCNNAEGKHWIILDGYSFNADYQRALKKNGYKLLIIDDYGHSSHYYADILLNQNLLKPLSIYENRECYTKLLMGSKYILLGEYFRKKGEDSKDISIRASKLLVMMGGADLQNVTMHVLKAIKSLGNDLFDMKIVVGPSNPRGDKIRSYLNNNGVHGTVYYAVEDMADLMVWADLAITAGGSSCWELAYMGVPCIIIKSADNQRYVIDTMKDCGAAYYLGSYSEVGEQDIVDAVMNLYESASLRAKMFASAKTLVDGKGASRVVDAICQS